MSEAINPYDELRRAYGLTGGILEGTDGILIGADVTLTIDETQAQWRWLGEPLLQCTTSGAFYLRMPAHPRKGIGMALTRLFRLNDIEATVAYTKPLRQWVLKAYGLTEVLELGSTVRVKDGVTNV